MVILPAECIVSLVKEPMDEYNDVVNDGWLDGPGFRVDYYYLSQRTAFNFSFYRGV